MMRFHVLPLVVTGFLAAGLPATAVGETQGTVTVAAADSPGRDGAALIGKHSAADKRIVIEGNTEPARQSTGPRK